MSERGGALEGLNTELESLIERWRDRVGPRVLEGVLLDHAQRLKDGLSSREQLSAPRKPSIEWSAARPQHIAWRFYDADSLVSQQDNILKLQAVCLEMDPGPPVLTDLTIQLFAKERPMLELRGRVVHRHKDQVAIQLEPATPQVRAGLDDAAHELRGVRPMTPVSGAPSPVAAPQVFAQTMRMGSPEPQVFAQTLRMGSPMEDTRQTMVSQAVPARVAKRWRLDQGSSPLDVLVEVAAMRPTGLLELKIAGSDSTLVLTLDRGIVHDISRAPLRAAESVEQLLKSAGKLTPEQVEQARAHARSYQTSVAEALVDLAILDYGEVRVALKTRVLFMARQLWSTTFSEASLTKLERLPQRSLSLPVFLWSMLFRHEFEQRTSMTIQDLEQRRSESSGMLIKRVEPLPCELPELELGAKHNRLLMTLLEEARQEPELISMSQMGKSEVLALLLTLKALGLIREEIPDHTKMRRTQQLGAVTALLARLQAKEPFEVLGLHWSAYNEEIEAAYQALKTKYALKGGEFSELEEASEMLADILKRAEEAYRVLINPRERAQHRATLVDRFKIASSIEMFEKQIDMAKIRRDIDEGVVYCKRLLELNPRHEQARQDLKLLQGIQEQRKKAQTT
jgi:hypothetical protein